LKPFNQEEELYNYTGRTGGGNKMLLTETQNKRILSRKWIFLHHQWLPIVVAFIILCDVRFILTFQPTRTHSFFTDPVPNNYQPAPSLTNIALSSKSTLQSSSSDEQVTFEATRQSNHVAKCVSFGGDLTRINLNEADNFIASLSVPTFAAFPSSYVTLPQGEKSVVDTLPKRMGLEGVIPGSFIVNNIIDIESCEDMIRVCEDKLQFGQFNAGKNNHGAIQILVSDDAADKLTQALSPFVDLDYLNSARNDGPSTGSLEMEYHIAGINRRWRIYRYGHENKESFSPHIDAGFPPSSLSKDGKRLIWDASVHPPENSTDANIPERIYGKNIVSRMTVLMYLNEDFHGGHTNFYSAVSELMEDQEPSIIASIKPKAGSILVFPQAVGEDAVEYARSHWPLHEGSPTFIGSHRPKYVIRSDILFEQVSVGRSEEEKNDPLWRYDDVVRQTFIPKSSVMNPLFLKHVSSLYNPHMGVENAGPLLYSFIRFTKVRTIVEIGAGYTTLWLLQALKDNDDEMTRVHKLEQEGKCKLLDCNWTVPNIVEDYNDRSSSLLCIDNCLHQKETATGAGAISETLGLGSYLKFVKGDAFDMKFDTESIDMLWCDFGVGSRMKDFVSSAWKSIRPGGYLLCHSTLTNTRTRNWLEKLRNGCGVDETGIPPEEVVELSLLEPQKRYQNSLSVLQKRKAINGCDFKEPTYSEYA